MAWQGWLITIVVFAFLAFVLGYMVYRKIKGMPSLTKDCCHTSGKSLVKLYKAEKKRNGNSCCH